MRSFIFLPSCMCWTGFTSTCQCLCEFPVYFYLAMQIFEVHYKEQVPKIFFCFCLSLKFALTTPQLAEREQVTESDSFSPWTLALFREENQPLVSPNLVFYDPMSYDPYDKTKHLAQRHEEQRQSKAGSASYALVLYNFPF